MQGFVVEVGGRLGPAAKEFIDEAVAECEMCDAARKAAASKIVRATGIAKSCTSRHAYILSIVRDSHFDSRAEERGAVYGGFCERRSGEFGWQTMVFHH